MINNEYDLWSEKPTKQAHDCLLTTVKQLQSNQQSSTEDLKDYHRYYSGRRLSETLTQASRMADRSFGTWNLAYSIVDSLVNRIGKNRPRPLPVPSGGDYLVRRQAKQLERFIVGQFMAMELYDISPEVFRDALIDGAGGLKFKVEDGKIKCERVTRLEVLVDETEGFYGQPRNIYHTRPVPRATLLAKYSRQKDKINAAPNTTNPLLPTNRLADYIDVTEGWCLPSAPGKKDGRFVQAIDGATLEDEKWTKDWFPFVFFNWSQPRFGFWGQGIVEQIYPYYYNVNWINDRILKCQKLLGIPTTFIEESSGVPSDRMAPNQIGKIIKFKNIKPETTIPYHVAPPELYAERDKQWTKGFEAIGLSELSATSRKPAGVTAGVAIRTLNDLETARFVEYGMRWETFFLDIAKLLIKMVKTVAEEAGDYEVPLIGSKFLNEIKWSKVSLEDNQYTLQVFPTSLVPAQPEGRLSFVQEMVQAGMIQQEAATELLSMPDIARWTDLTEAGRDVIRESLELIIEERIFNPPEPFDDLEYGIEYGRQVYQKAKLDQAPEEILQDIRDYISACIDLMDAANPPQEAAPPGPPGAPPIAVPQQAPESNLLPFPTAG